MNDANWTDEDLRKWGDHIDLQADIDRKCRDAYAEGRKDERENLERIGAVRDCPACAGRGERLMLMTNGPDAYQETVDCPECKGTGYECRAVLSAGAPAVPLQDSDSSHVHLAAPGGTVPSALTVGTPLSELSDAALIDAFIAHNEQFSRSSDHPAWLHCKDGDGNSTSLRGDWFAAALRNVLTGEQA